MDFSSLASLRYSHIYDRTGSRSCIYIEITDMQYVYIIGNRKYEASGHHVVVLVSVFLGLQSHLRGNSASDKQTIP